MLILIARPAHLCTFPKLQPATCHCEPLNKPQTVTKGKQSVRLPIIDLHAWARGQPHSFWSELCSVSVTSAVQLNSQLANSLICNTWGSKCTERHYKPNKSCSRTCLTIYILILQPAELCHPIQFWQYVFCMPLNGKLCVLQLIRHGAQTPRAFVS